MRQICITLLLAVLFSVAGTYVLGVKEMKFYNILGIAEDADEKTIKRAYKKQGL